TTMYISFNRSSVFCSTLLMTRLVLPTGSQAIYNLMVPSLSHNPGAIYNLTFRNGLFVLNPDHDIQHSSRYRRCPRRKCKGIHPRRFSGMDANSTA
ncbi:hypothetical protein BJ138DRAFT_1142509, partial [Hygrophoropsis aurantiaca]